MRTPTILRFPLAILICFVINHANAQNTGIRLARLAQEISSLPDSIIGPMSDTLYSSNICRVSDTDSTDSRSQSITTYGLRNHGLCIMRTSTGTLLCFELPDPADDIRTITWSYWKYSEPYSLPSNNWWSSDHLRGPDWSVVWQSHAEYIILSSLQNIRTHTQNIRSSFRIENIVQRERK